MIVYSTSDGKVLKTPAGLEDVTLKKYLEFSNNKELDAKGLFEEEQLGAKELRYIAKFVAFWTEGVTYEELQGASNDQVMAMYLQINKSLTLPETTQYTNVIEFEKELYFLPMAGMQKSNVFEFIEAAEVEHRTNQLKKGQLAALPHLCAILLRKKDEKYDKEFDEVTRKIRAKKFLNLKMSDAVKVGFFLAKQSNDLAKFLSTYSKAKKIVLQDKLKTKPNLMKALDGLHSLQK